MVTGDSREDVLEIRLAATRRGDEEQVQRVSWFTLPVVIISGRVTDSARVTYTLPSGGHRRSDQGIHSDCRRLTKFAAQACQAAAISASTAQRATRKR